MAGSEDVFQKEMNMGHTLAWDQQWDKAAMAYRNALEEFPGNSTALSSLGLALSELQRYTESLKVYQLAAQAAPNDPVPLENVGHLSRRLGNPREAIQAFFKAAELSIRNQDTEKALSNWERVIQMDPEQLNAHSYLAMVHERLGHSHQAAGEYLMMASLLQRSGNTEKAAETVLHALQLDPNNSEAQRARTLLQSGQLLPKPAQVQESNVDTKPMQKVRLSKNGKSPKYADTGFNPVEEAQKQALTRLARILFDYNDRSSSKTPKLGMKAIARGTGELDARKAERAKIMLHIRQAIDAQTGEQEGLAAEELIKALEAGFTDAALSFDLGFLLSRGEQAESSLEHLEEAVKDADFALGAHLLLAQLLREMGRLPEAMTESLEALKAADAAVVPAEQADEISQLYEPLIEARIQETDPVVMEQLCDNVGQLLLRPNWRSGMLAAREQLPKSEEGTPPMPLAEILAESQSSKVIETIGKVHSLARTGHLRAAMDEAFEAIKYAPTFLPLHSLVGDLLMQDGRTQDAVTKYSVVAEAYAIRGEASQAVKLLQRIVQVAPMDLAVRTRLIEQLAAHGRVDEAIGEYIELANIYYRLADLDMARKTYATALNAAEMDGANSAWKGKLLRRMADIDLQRLDWRQALSIFEQLRTLEPDDMSVHKNLIELNMHLNQRPQAGVELQGLLDYLQSDGKRGGAIPLLEDLVKENPREVFLRRVLADEFRQAGRLSEAVTQLDALGNLLLTSGDKQGAFQVIEAILALNPPNSKDYQLLLAKLKSEA